MTMSDAGARRAATRTDGDGDRSLAAALVSLRADVVGMASAYEDELSLVDEQHRPSVRNLLHYVALRDHDLRVLQEGLAARG